MRRRAAVAAALAAGALVLAGCGADRPSTACVAPLPRDFVGIAAPELLTAARSARRRTMRAQHRAGARILRQLFDWSRIESVPGRYDLRAYDRLVEDAARAGMDLLPVLFRAPRFRALPGSGRAVARPLDLDAMAPLARLLARRYGPGGTFWRAHPDVAAHPVHAWQIWNEPNLDLYWGGRPDVRAYARLLRSSAAAIRAVDPRAEIVTAGLPNSRLGVPLTTFVRGLYDAGAGDAIDTVAVNLYATTPNGVLVDVRRVRQTMIEAGDATARVWITEFGWADRGPRSSFTIGGARQARYVRTTLRRAAASSRLLRLRGAVYYAWKDLPPYPGIGDFWGLHTGLLDSSGTPKPALAGFAAGAAARCSR